MNKKLLVGFILILAVNCQLKETLFHSINGMLGVEPPSDHLVHWVDGFGTHYTANTDPTGLHAHFPNQVQLPHIKLNVTPYDKFVPLVFGSRAKVSILSYKVGVNGGGEGYVLASAHHGFRQGSTVSMITGYGIATVSPKPQFEQVPVERCERNWYKKKICRIEYEPRQRGFYPHEMGAIIGAAMRRSAVAMKQSLGFSTDPAKTPLNFDSWGLSFADEHAKLRAFLSESEYVWTDVAGIEMEQSKGAFYHTMKGLGDQGIRNIMRSSLAEHQHSNFLYVATTNTIFYVIVHKNGEKTFDLHVSAFTHGGGVKFPAGAFAKSVGEWKVESEGEAGTPTFKQIMDAFNFK